MTPGRVALAIVRVRPQQPLPGTLLGRFETGPVVRLGKAPHALSAA